MVNSLFPRRLIALAVAASAVQACDAPERAGEEQDGVYGASSGPNPNIEDVQAGAAPAAPLVEGKEIPPPAETLRPQVNANEGRSSARTGATEGH